MTPRLGKLLSVTKAAEYLGLSTSQLDKVIRRGEIAVVRHTTGRVMGIYTAHCDAWQETHVSTVRPTTRSSLGVDAAMQKLLREVGAEV